MKKCYMCGKEIIPYHSYLRIVSDHLICDYCYSKITQFIIEAHDETIRVKELNDGTTSR